MSIGERLKNLRVGTKKTLKDESEIFNVSINTIYRWEHNLTIPRKSAVKKIADYYNVPFEWLLYENARIENGKYAIHTIEPNSEIEQKLLKMIKRLSDINKYKILGYVERMLVENQGFN